MYLKGRKENVFLPIYQMQGQTSAMVKGLPLHLSSAALHELCSHYGAIRIRPLSGPMVRHKVALLD